MIYYWYSFSPCVDNGSHFGSLEFPDFRTGFVTFSRLTDASDFFLSSFFRLWHDVLLAYFTLLDVLV